MRVRTGLSFLTLAALLGGVPALSASAAVDTGPSTDRPASPGAGTAVERVEVPSPSGALSVTEVERSEASTFATIQADAVPIQVTGPSENRIDIAILGDGYTSGELGTFATQAADRWAQVSALEPFATYKNFFNVWRVDVVSNESGADNDPTEGIERDTALGANYYCGGIARLLCVNTSAVWSFAANAPHDNIVLVLVNSTTYGGAGYSSGIATSAGGNPSSGQIAIHELGHSLGKLADEYVLNPGHYSGPETTRPNTSIYPSAQMQSRQTKWYRWLGQSTPDGGTIGTYEGASEGATGVYRPSQNSLMRSLGREFNSVGREQLIRRFYERLSPIDSVSPGTGQVLTGQETVTTSVVQPVGHSQSVSWLLDGSPIAGAEGQTSLDLSSLGLSSDHTLTLRVRDDTSAVIDPNIRDQDLTDTRNWTVDAG